MDVKKALSTAIILCMLALFPAAVFADAAEDLTGLKRPDVLLDGEKIDFAHAPYVKNGVTMAPGKLLLEKLGFHVSWDEETKQLAGTKSGTEIKFLVGQDIATINNAAYKLPHSVRMLDNEVYIPLRFTAANDNRAVNWHASSETVFITSSQTKQVRIMLPMLESLPEAEVGELVNQLSKHLEEQYKISADWELVPGTYYQDKLNLKIAAGDPADLSYVPNIGLFPNELVSAIAWKLDDFIPNYDALNKLSSQAVTEVKAMNKGLYGLPKLKTSVDASFPVINQDWLDRLGLVNPRTMDEVYQVMRHFKTNDPDGNGKHDSYGLTGVINRDNLGTLAWVEHVFNENVSRYEIRDGKLVDLAVSEGTRNALQWLNTVYKEGLLHPEFAVLTSDAAKQQFVDQKAGILAMDLSEAAEAEAAIKRPISPFASLKSSDTAQAVTALQYSYNGAYFVSSLSNNNKLFTALETMDALHTIAGDQKQDDKLRKFVEEIVGTEQVKLGDVPKTTEQRYKLIAEERETIKVKPLLDASLYAKLDNDLRYAKQKLDEKMLEQKVKFIMGATSLKDWDAYVDTLLKDEQYIAIMNTFNK